MEDSKKTGASVAFFSTWFETGVLNIGLQDTNSQRPRCHGPPPTPFHRDAPPALARWKGGASFSASPPSSSLTGFGHEQQHVGLAFQPTSRVFSCFLQGGRGCFRFWQYYVLLRDIMPDSWSLERRAVPALGGRFSPRKQTASFWTQGTGMTTFNVVVSRPRGSQRPLGAKY